MACVAIALTLVANASAAPTQDVEPNDNIFQLAPPISPEGVAGTVNTVDDIDLYMVKLRPQRQVKLVFQLTNGNTCGRYLDFSLKTVEGSSIESNDLSGSHPSEVYTITTPGTVGGPSQEFFLRFNDGGYSDSFTPCSYLFAVTDTAGGPTDAIDSMPTPPLPTVATSEPNDVESQAFGALAAGTNYTGKIETSNDVDWLFAWLQPGANATIELAASLGDAYVQVYTEFASSSTTSVSSNSGEVQTATFTVPYGTNKYLIKITGDLGTLWRLNVTPNDAVSGPPVAPAAYVRIAHRTVRRGKSIRIRIFNSSATALSYRLKRGSKVVRHGRRSIIGGVATISTKRLRRGNYKLSFSVVDGPSGVARIRLK